MSVPGSKREVVKLLDFGISKVRDGGANLTRTQTIMGTANYMSPEQASGRTDEADGRTDEFALAAMVYELLSGKMAFPGDAPLAVLYSVVHQQPERLGSLIPTLDAAIEEVVNRGLAKRPDDRFPTVEEFCRALSQVALRRTTVRPSVAAPPPATMAQRPLGAQPLPPSTTLRLSTGQVESVDEEPVPPRRPWAPRLIGGGALTAAVATVVVLVLRGGSHPPPPPPPLGPASTGSVAQTAGPPPVSPPLPATPATGQDSPKGGPTAHPQQPPAVASAELLATVTLDVSTSPGEARVVDVRKKEVLGLTPLHHQIRRRTGVLEIRIEKSGYLSKEASIPLDRDFRGSFQLEKRKAIIKL